MRCKGGCWHLSTEAVEGASGSLECVDDVKSSDGLPLGMLRVGNGVTDDLQDESERSAKRGAMDARIQGTS